MDAFPVPANGITLDDFLRVTRRRRWTILCTVALCCLAASILTAMMTPVYSARSQLLVQASLPREEALDLENPLVGLLAMTQPQTVGTQVRILQSRDLVDDVLRLCGVPRGPDGRSEPRIKVSDVRDTSVIEVSVESRDPKLAARIANAMLDEYQRETRGHNLEEIYRARRFVEREERKARRELAEAEAALIRFRRTHRVAALTTEQESRVRQVVDMETQATQMTGSIRRTEAQVRTLRAALDREPMERLVPVTKENPRIDALQSKLVELEVQRSALVQEYQETSPRVVALDTQIASLRQQLSREPKERRILLHALNPVREEMLTTLKRQTTELEALRAAERELLRALADRRGRVQQLGPWEIELAQLNRARDTAEKQSLLLISRLNDLRIRESAGRSTARIIERAYTPIHPVRPRRLINLFLALVVGFPAGFALAFLIESRDDRISAPDEADGLLGLPALGSIPAEPYEQGRLMTTVPSASPLAESYRFLRTNVTLAMIEAPLRTLVVTSAHRGEGKSTTAMNLAVAMALEGRRVVLVDADLRRPTLHRLLDISAAPGLTDVLIDHQPWQEILRPAATEGLSVLTSGDIPQNPAELLNSPAMARLIEELGTFADVVLFDTPPCLAVTDAQVLAAKVDGVLLVAESEAARRAEIRLAKQLFARARARTVGLVFTKSASRGPGRYGRRASYYYDETENGRAAIPASLAAPTGRSRPDPEECP
jgi:capsular exopolysaccharide synthesis family protein